MLFFLVIAHHIDYFTLIMSHFKTNSIDPKRNSERLFFVDLIRLLSMIAIIHFHVFEAFFYSDIRALIHHSYFETRLEDYSRFMAFSGFSIVIISYFMIGLKGLSPKKVKRLLVVSAVGIVTLFLVYFEDGFSSFEWDIYPFIGVSSLVLFFLSFSSRALKIASLISMGLLSIPQSWLYFPSIESYFFYNSIFGDFIRPGKGSWALIPWIGLPILFYTIGRQIRIHKSFRIRLTILPRIELLIWLFLLSLCATQWGSFYKVPIGPGFYQFVHSINRLEIFCHLMIVFFFLRLGFVKEINAWAAKNGWVSWVSKLYLNKKFFLFYIVQWGLIGFFSQFTETYHQYPRLVFDLVLLLIFPLSELACWALLNFTKEIQQRLRGAASPQPSS